MDMATALAELGATEASINAEARDRLDRDGYAPLPGVLSEPGRPLRPRCIGAL